MRGEIDIHILIDERRLIQLIGDEASLTIINGNEREKYLRLSEQEFLTEKM